MPNWKSIVGAVAPTIATALGGPLAGAAVRAIGDKLLGKPDASEEEVAAAVAGASPDQLLKLKDLEQDFQKHMADLGVDLEKLEQADRANARAREVAIKDWVPATLAVTIFVFLIAMSVALFYVHVPPENQQQISILLGMLGAGTTSVLGYYFGSSASSDTKTAILGRVAESRK